MLSANNAGRLDGCIFRISGIPWDPETLDFSIVSHSRSEKRPLARCRRSARIFSSSVRSARGIRAKFRLDRVPISAASGRPVRPLRASRASSSKFLALTALTRGECESSLLEPVLRVGRIGAVSFLLATMHVSTKATPANPRRRGTPRYCPVTDNELQCYYS